MLNNKVSFFIPSKTQEGKSLKFKQNINFALHFLTKEFGGATVMPICKGAFKMQDGSIMLEKVAIIECFTDKQDCIRFIRFAIRMKKRWNQQAIAYSINNCLYVI